METFSFKNVSVFLFANFVASKEKMDVQKEKILEKILSRANAMFMRYGLKSVTMDDVARELGMSKKTLYQYVESKPDLIQQTTYWHVENEKKIFTNLRENATDAMDALLSMAIYSLEMFKNLSSSLIYDLQKYYPESWKIVEHLQKDCIYDDMIQNLHRGRAEDLYRIDFDADIVARFFAVQAFCITDEDLFPPKGFKKEKLFMEHILYHLHSIATPQGLARMKEKINQK